MALAQGDVYLQYPNSAAWTEIPWTSNNQEGLADATLAAAHSDAVDIATLLATHPILDVLLYVRYNVQTSLGTGPVISLFCAPEVDGAYPPVAVQSLHLVGNIVPSAAAANERSRSFSLRASLGYIPEIFKVNLLNNAGNALSATTDEVQVYYQLVAAKVKPTA